MHTTVQIIRTPGLLIGALWHDAGAIVEIPEDRARRLIHDGHARAFSAADARPVRPGNELETAALHPAREHAAKRIGK